MPPGHPGPPAARPHSTHTPVVKEHEIGEGQARSGFSTSASPEASPGRVLGPRGLRRSGLRLQPALQKLEGIHTFATADAHKLLASLMSLHTLN